MSCKEVSGDRGLTQGLPVAESGALRVLQERIHQAVEQPLLGISNTEDVETHDTAIELALIKHRFELVPSLIELGCEPNVTIGFYPNPISFLATITDPVCSHDVLKTAELFFKAGVALNQERLSPLYVAIKKQFWDMAEWLIENGADIYQVQAATRINLPRYSERFLKKDADYRKGISQLALNTVNYSAPELNIQIREHLSIKLFNLFYLTPLSVEYFFDQMSHEEKIHFANVLVEAINEVKNLRDESIDRGLKNHIKAWRKEREQKEQSKKEKEELALMMRQIDTALSTCDEQVEKLSNAQGQTHLEAWKARSFLGK